MLQRYIDLISSNLSLLLHSEEVKLSLVDSISIILGIIVGIGVFETGPLIAQNVQSEAVFLGLWAFGGVLSLCGALCYAELSSAYPLDGGDYHYLKRSYGSVIAFLYGWAQLVIVRPGSLAALAFPFAHYSRSAFESLGSHSTTGSWDTYIASVAILVLTILNASTLRRASRVQNLLTVVKFFGIIVVIATGLLLRNGSSPMNIRPLDGQQISLALILVLFAYGGWNEISFVAAQVKDPEKNLRRTLFFGTLVVTLVYLLLNGAYICALGFEPLRSSSAPAADVMRLLMSENAAGLISILIALSALGALHGMILTGARISAAMGRDYTPLRFLSTMAADGQTPVFAILLQGVLSIGVVLFTGSFTGAVVYTTTVVWLFFLLVGISLFILRVRDSDIPRPYKVWGYPLTPIFFILSCALLVWGSVSYDPTGSAISIGIVASGLLIKRSLKNNVKRSQTVQ